MSGFHFYNDNKKELVKAFQRRVAIERTVYERFYEPSSIVHQHICDGDAESPLLSVLFHRYVGRQHGVYLCWVSCNFAELARLSDARSSNMAAGTPHWNSRLMFYFGRLYV